MRAKMINEEMSQYDIDLISQANKVHWIDSYLVDQMVKKAESDEARKELDRISRYLYHKEEAASGNI